MTQFDTASTTCCLVDLPMPPDPNDKSYAEATPEAIGRMFGGMFKGMLESGMDRIEALQVVIQYAVALALRPTEPKADDDA